MKGKPKSVDAYIASAPTEARAKLAELRQVIRAAAPKASERMSYGMPYYEYLGRVAYFRLGKAHIGLYVMPPVLQEHRKELKGYETAKATVRFPLKEKLPAVLIRKLVRTRVEKNRNEALKTYSRGHKYRGRGLCPVCWPERRKKSQEVNARIP